MAKIKKIVVDAENIEPNVEAATDAKSEVAEKKRGAVKSTGVKKEPMKASKCIFTTETTDKLN